MKGPFELFGLCLGLLRLASVETVAGQHVAGYLECAREDSNLHELSSLEPKSSASASSATRAFTK